MRSHRELSSDLFGRISEYKTKVIFSVVLIVISTFCITYAPKVAGQTVNFFLDGLTSTNYGDVFNNLILLAALYVAGYLLKLPASRIMIFAGEKITYKLRLGLYDGLTRAQLKYIYSNTSGNIMGRINNDLMNVRNFIIFYLSEFLAELLTIVLTIILIFSTNFELGLVYLCLLLIFAIIVYYFVIKSNIKYKRHQNGMGAMIDYMGDSIANHMAIQAYECQDYVEENFEKINYDVDKYYTSSRFSTGVVPPIAKLFLNIGNIAVYLYGVYLLINHEMLLGSLLTVILYGQLLSKPLLKESKNMTSLETSFASLDRVLEIINAPSIRPEGLIKTDKDDVKGEIEFKNVCYGEIINDFNLKTDSLDLVSITGQIGSGKSTLMELLMGLYPVDSGEILLDGRNIYEIDPNSYRNILGYVPSQKWIFEGTIAENIGYGIAEYDIDDIKKACELIGFDKIIEKMPEKYDTKIPDEKNKISDSERDMICIARALIRNPKILILDEVTVDITDILDEMTVFIITDDENIINRSDKVIDFGEYDV